MSHLHATAIAPMALPWERLVVLRRNARRLWDAESLDAARAIRVGAHGAAFLDDTLFAQFGSAADFALESAPFLRKNDSLWFPFHGFDAKVFAEFLAQQGLRGTIGAHLVLTRSGTLSLVASFDFPDVLGAFRFGQRDIRGVFERAFLSGPALAALATALRNEVLRPFFDGEVPAPAPPRADSTHLFTVVTGADAESVAALQRAHADEEGASDSLREAAGQSAESVDYVRFGWSYTTLALRGYTKEIALLPLMLYIQNLWFAQKTLREQVGYFAYDDLGIRRERTLAIELEALNLERTFAGNEAEDFRSNLKPWLAAAFDFVFAKWGLAETRANVGQIVGDLREYYERKLDVYESRQSKRQAGVLFWIALLQFASIFSNIAGYVYFLELGDIDIKPYVTTHAFALAVFASPVLLTLVALAVTWLYFTDRDTKS